MPNKPLPPQEIREVVARELWMRGAAGNETPIGQPPVYPDVAGFEKLPKEAQEFWRSEANQFLSELSKPPYNVVVLADDQTPPEPQLPPRFTCEKTQQDMIDDGWHKTKPLVDSTVKEG